MPAKTYADLINRGGTIYSKGGMAYSNPTQLATDLGILPHQIDWTQIANEPAPVAAPAPTAPPAPPVVAPPAPTPTSAPGTFTTPSGAVVNAATGALISGPPASTPTPTPTNYLADLTSGDKATLPTDSKGNKTTTLVDIYNSRQDIKDMLAKSFPGQNPLQVGTAANTWLNDWWNREGPKEYPGISLTQPKPGITTTAPAPPPLPPAVAAPVAPGEPGAPGVGVPAVPGAGTPGLPATPVAPDLVNQLNTYNEQHGIVGLQDQLTDVNQRIADLMAATSMGVRNIGGKIMPLELQAGRQNALKIQAQDQLDQLNAEKSGIVDQLNTKQTIVSNLMNLTQANYTNALNAYNSAFSQAIQIQQVMNQTVDNARADLQVIYGTIEKAFASGSLTDINDLPADTLLTLDKLDMQLGYGAGFSQSLLANFIPGGQKILNTVTSTDKTKISVITQNPDGTISTTLISTGLAAGGGGDGDNPTTKAIISAVNDYKSSYATAGEGFREQVIDSLIKRFGSANTDFITEQVYLKMQSKTEKVLTSSDISQFELGLGIKPGMTESQADAIMNSDPTVADYLAKLRTTFEDLKKNNYTKGEAETAWKNDQSPVATSIPRPIKKLFNEIW